MPHLSAILALLGLFSLAASRHRPAPRTASREAEAEEAAVDTAARVIGLALIALAPLPIWP